MKKKKFIIINTIGLFILMFLTHFIYDLLPNFITSLFFPVNESIMEHIKMVYTTYFIYNIILYLFMKKRFNNYPLNFVVTAIFNIGLFLLVYLPIFNFFGEIMAITITLLFISIFISSFISYKILSSKKFKFLNIVAIFTGILIFILFGFLTYNPPIYYLWYDYKNKLFGIK